MALYARPNRPELDAVKVPSALDIAWAAGIYEGEGTCRLCGKTKRGFMVQVSQKDPELLFWLRDWFGGSVGPIAKSGCRTWNICGDRARLFVAQIYGRLTLRRRDQVDAAKCLEFMQGKSPVGLTVDELKNQMLAYYSAAFAETWRGNSKRRNESRKALNRRKKENSGPVLISKSA